MSHDTVSATCDAVLIGLAKWLVLPWHQHSCSSGGAQTNLALRMYQSVTEQAKCDDSFKFGYRVSQLVSVCGLERGYFMYDGSREGVANDSWIRYRGDLFIYYVEWVSLANVGGVPSTNMSASLPQLSRRGV